MPAKWHKYILATLCLILYVFLGYFQQRHEPGIFISYLILFTLYIYMLYQHDKADVNFWLKAAVLFRLVLLFSIPNLSDDFYRFIWDGRLLAAGVHPFAEIPAFYIEQASNIPGITLELFQQLNSQHYFTIYPPLAQFIFWLSVVISPSDIFGSVIVIRVLIILAELGILLLIKKLLLYFQLPARQTLLYALNPLIILELSGNLHFEVFYIFFILLSFYLLIKRKIGLSAIIFSFAVGIKLLPLIFLPAILWHLRWKRGVIYGLIVLASTAILFIPLLSAEIIENFNQSLGLYFQKFEFNASIYYLVREWGFWKYGYNIIQTIGWKLALISALLIMIISVVNGQQSTVHSPQSVSNIKLWTVYHGLWTKFLFILFTYLLFTTTVHPWYITPLIAFSVFTNYRIAMVWSFLIFFTYAGYSELGFSEIYCITFTEYLIVSAFLAVEIYRNVKRTAHHILPQS